MPSLERRRFLEAAVAAGVTVSGSGTASASATANDRVEWTFGADGIGRSSPTIVGGVVHVGANDAVYAIDAESGDEQWSFDEPRDFNTAVVADERVYVGTRDGAVYAIDAGSKDERWRFTEPAGSIRSPTVADGIVYARTREGAVYAIDAESGNERWRFTEPLASKSSLASVTVVDGRVFVTGFDGVVYAVDAESGEKRWHYDEPGEWLRASPTVADGTVYVSNDGLYAIDAETGTEKWTSTGVGALPASPTVADGTVYVGRDFLEGEFDPALFAFDAETGDAKRRFSDVPGSVDTATTVVGGTLFVKTVSVAGYPSTTGVFAIDGESGDTRWEFTDVGGSHSHPIVADGTVYASDHGTLYALDAGVNGSSEDSRALLGTYNHHDESISRGPVEWLTDNWWLPAGIGAVGAGAAYAYSRADGGSGRS